MLSRWQGGFAALVVTLVTGALVILDVTDDELRRWWASHALTTDTVAGLLVLLITLLVVAVYQRTSRPDRQAETTPAKSTAPEHSAC